jgi:hypothetical protein
MTAMDDDLAFDSDGIPILTDLVREDRLAAAAHRPAGTMAPADIAGLLMGSELFREQLDETAASLAREVRDKTEQLLRSAIEKAISEALDNCDISSFETIRQRLESSLPELLARALQE